jgi:hypothetical protein
LIGLFRRQPRTLPVYYAAGEQLRRLSRDADIASRGGRWRKQAADAVGVSESTLNKCFQFRRRYRREELAELERLKVGWSRLTIALGVQGKRERHQLLRRAETEGWDDHTLQRAIQQRKGTRRGGGRPRKEVKSQGIQPDLTHLIDLTQPWSKFYAKVWESGQEGYRAELKDLSDTARQTLQELLRDAAEKLKALRKQSGDALAQVKALQRLLPTAAD